MALLLIASFFPLSIMCFMMQLPVGAGSWISEKDQRWDLLIMTTHPQGKERRKISWCQLPFVICLYCSKKSHGEQLLYSHVIRSLLMSLCLPGNCAHWQNGVCSPFQMEDKVKWYIENYVHVIQSVWGIHSVFYFWQAALYPGNSLHHSVTPSVTPKIDSVFLACLLCVFTERDQGSFSEH